MLNWPGANLRSAAPPTGARVRVKVSPVSFVTWRTSKGSGRIGSGTATLARAAVSVAAIEIQELHAGGLEARDHHLRESLQQLVAEARVLLALGAQAGPVERERAHGVERARVEAGLVGCEQPRPAEHLAALDRLDRDLSLVGDEDLDRHLALAHYEEAIGGFALPEDELPGLEHDVRDAAH